MCVVNSYADRMFIPNFMTNRYNNTNNTYGYTFFFYFSASLHFCQNVSLLLQDLIYKIKRVNILYCTKIFIQVMSRDDRLTIVFIYEEVYTFG